MKETRLYDWQADPGFLTMPADTADRGAVEVRAVPAQPGRTNAVTGHGLDCACSRCPGWYQQRANLTQDHMVRDLERTRVVPQPRQTRPLTDLILPWSMLMATFTICAVVLLPVVMPFVALGSMSLGLVAVSLAVVASSGLGMVLANRRQVRRGSGRVIPGRMVDKD